MSTAAQGRRGRKFGALLSTADGQPADDRSTTSAEKRPTSRQSSKSSRDPPPHQGQSKPKAKDSSSKEPSKQSTTSDTAGPTEVGETCLICAESIKYYALGSCSHRTCHICAIRMRALYKKRDCALCKTELNQVIFTSNPDSNFSSFDLSNMKFKDEHLSIYCESFEQLDELLGYLKFNCPHPDCTNVLNNWNDLKHHTRTVHHGLSLCDLCCSNKKVFAHEHTLFTAKGITVHMNQGSVGTGKGIRRSRLVINDTTTTDSLQEEDEDDGFKGHPRCGFCSVYYYDDDQLYQHCRDKHEQCFICVRNGVGRWQYYLDYKHLESHFRDDHYLCRQSTCIQSRFVVYETALELQTHQIEVHGAEMGMKAIKDARKLETNFVYSGAQDQQSSLTHTNRVSTSTTSTARDQRAGRGIAVMDIPPISGEGSTTLSNVNRIVPGLAPNTGRSNNSRPHKGKSKSPLAREIEEPNPESADLLVNLNLGGCSSSSQIDIQRHTVLLQRVSEAVNGAESKITTFKAAVRTYRNNEMGGADFLDTICNIFQHKSEVIGPILSNLLDLLDIEDARKGELLEKWLDLKLEQTQYPTLDTSSKASQTPADNYPHLIQSSSSPSGGHGLGSLQSSTWIRQQPTYQKLIHQRTNHPQQTREVPGLVPKKLKSGGQGKSTPWASSSSGSSTPVTRVKTNPIVTSTTNTRTNPSTTRPIPTKSASSIGNQSSHNPSHFPSLPTKQIANLKSTWKPTNHTLTRQDPGGAHWVTSSSSSANDTAANQNSNPTTNANNNKKSKKILLFTNTR
ncbi:hypothetical protein MJO28_016051 [Puccinia striiformis f. sp. tritici]|uniref:RING-type E3 ubiquitin transferase n=2 Tax=Puccinia striiformis f. sp. tritici TaxID=168172 RepID=A0A0L0W1T4_9BASI|nr:hypothetical protein Pst134EA_028925 [Puccinia striiformis f. sp. tritici]KAI9617328.1 hypothetical protein H4Q26_013199 [Puccinia striiformis f. sp. tritici PST-130]KNF05456.1 hypothetical protein PSTG_01266 [Puccinia striiformis f. sp. tritici PST-78]KAH9446940.1 hypothetical protein Pst134EA_028925 [Puccinia striiformis f. sp. tritici]KAI7936054.1 hypothetical protein MJO29_015357 [Puccinia striiformis f. sp. tritici]KAI7937152.1 hypothetical protein MJO28_016051 [Puccinia striiformis f.